MEALLNDIFSNSQTPFLSAFILGLMTAISPCPMATNITAVGFIGKNLENRNKVFINGLIYTLGRAFTYVSLALIIYFGADQFRLSGFLQQYGEKFLGPLLIIVGLFLLGLFKLNIRIGGGFSRKFENKKSHSGFEVFMLGVLFALAFCPYSGVLYFVMLIPMTIQSAPGLYLPLVFALATGIPVILFAWLLAYTVSGVGKFYNRIRIFEIWFRRIVAVLFVGFGIYYSIIVWN